MTTNNKQSASALFEQLNELLDALKASSAGIVVYDQLNQLLHDWQKAREHADRSHATLIALLLETFRNHSDAAEIMDRNAGLVRARQLASAFSREMYGRMPEQHHSDMNPVDALKQQIHGMQHRQEDAGADGRADNTKQGSSFVERRVNSAYRDHLDRKRGEIEKIQDGLETEAKAAIAQNREFGALLKTELAALQQVSSTDEIDALKDILIGGTRELLQGQQKLEERLLGSVKYMNLIRSDSKGLRDELNKVRLLSLTDEATGLPNRRAFLRRIEDEIGRAQRYGTPLSLALIDLDFFKQINDRHGHAAGDDVLKWYAQEPLAIFRHYDMVARYGGEEFSVLLPSTNEEGALRALEKVMCRVKETECLTSRGENIDVPSFSAGLTVYHPGEVFTDFIDRADKALYQAKSNGRNRVESLLQAGKTGNVG